MSTVFPKSTRNLEEKIFTSITLDVSNSFSASTLKLRCAGLIAFVLRALFRFCLIFQNYQAWKYHYFSIAKLRKVKS